MLAPHYYSLSAAMPVSHRCTGKWSQCCTCPVYEEPCRHCWQGGVDTCACYLLLLTLWSSSMGFLSESLIQRNNNLTQHQSPFLLNCHNILYLPLPQAPARVWKSNMYVNKGGVHRKLTCTKILLKRSETRARKLQAGLSKPRLSWMFLQLHGLPSVALSFPSVNLLQIYLHLMAGSSWRENLPPTLHPDKGSIPAFLNNVKDINSRLKPLSCYPAQIPFLQLPFA